MSPPTWCCGRCATSASGCKGSSGSGKSSLLAAGILPALAKSHYFADKPWDVRSMRPGATPYDTLAALLDLRTTSAAAAPGDGAPAGTDKTQPDTEPGAKAAPAAGTAAGGRTLLVVDQFEVTNTRRSQYAPLSRLWARR